MKVLISLCVCLMTWSAWSQDFNAQIQVDASRVDMSNKQVFVALQNDLTSWFNATSFSGKRRNDSEKIRVRFYLNILTYQDDFFTATLQMQLGRPIFGTSYESPLLSVMDQEVSFAYEPFSPLVWSKNNLQNNLVAIFGYYAYLALGVDADTFAPMGGTPYFVSAQQVVNTAQSAFPGWNDGANTYSRSAITQAFNTPANKPFRTFLYQYHLQGLDQMAVDPEKFKPFLAEQISGLKPLLLSRPQNPLFVLLFDAKSDEWVQLFSQGPSFDALKLKGDLDLMAPMFAQKWRLFTR
ncbi:MAG: hypothetical protein RLZZ593_28 [Bacteroidota bacterium]